ncbi:MAG: segregation/condensation protein A [Nannocystales bacterium]
MSTSDDQKPPSSDGGGEDDRVDPSGDGANTSVVDAPPTAPADSTGHAGEASSAAAPPTVGSTPEPTVLATDVSREESEDDGSPTGSREARAVDVSNPPDVGGVDVASIPDSEDPSQVGHAADAGQPVVELSADEAPADETAPVPAAPAEASEPAGVVEQGGESKAGEETEPREQAEPGGEPEGGEEPEPGPEGEPEPGEVAPETVPADDMLGAPLDAVGSSPEAEPVGAASQTGPGVSPDAASGAGAADVSESREGPGEGLTPQPAATPPAGSSRQGSEGVDGTVDPTADASGGDADVPGSGSERVGEATSPGSTARSEPEGVDGAAAAQSDAVSESGDSSTGEQTPADAGTSVGPEASSPPMTSMLGSVNEARSWLLELPDFEGPLDLLLHLVRRHELDILDIPISFVTEKYLEYLAFMQALDLEVAGDYLVMAATLAYLKSRELVPTEPTEVSDEGQSEDEGPDPREELIARLLEYQKYRAAASDLDQLPIQGRDVFSRGGRIELPPVDPGLAPLTLFRLAEAYNRVLDRARIHKSHDVVMETVSVAQRMNQLTSMLIEQERVEFEALFLGKTWNSESELRSMLVVTLMSVLELTKLGVIFVHQDSANGAIVIERKATAEEAKQAIADYDENISFGKAKPGVAEASASGEAAASSDDPVAPQVPESDAEPDSDV